MMNHIKKRPISNQMQERYSELRRKENEHTIDSLEQIALDRIRKNKT